VEFCSLLFFGKLHAQKKEVVDRDALTEICRKEIENALGYGIKDSLLMRYHFF
jgi:hypothetical protein